MLQLEWLWFEFHRFVQSGGWVLWLIVANCLALLTLALSRYSYLLLGYRRDFAPLVQNWQQRQDKDTWASQQIRQSLICQGHLKLIGSQEFIRMLILICPLLGLMGTVSGMIEVFDVLGATGTGNARAMASGIGRATIPTMAGMMVSILGLLLQSRLNRLIAKREQQLALALKTLSSRND